MKKKSTTNIDAVLAAAVSDSNIPVLILDSRWHELFPPGEKPESIVQLETVLENLLKEQGKLVNECKEMKRAKKKLMDGIVANMGASSQKVSKQSQKLIVQMNERIEAGTNRIMELPALIREANERLLVEGVKISYRSMKETEMALQEIKRDIENLRISLEEKEQKKESMENQRDVMYSYMHDLLGPEMVELFDRDIN